MSASRSTLPSWTSCIAAVAVASFDTDPIRNRCRSGSTGTGSVPSLPVSTWPYPRVVTVSPSLTTATVAPAMLLASSAAGSISSSQAFTSLAFNTRGSTAAAGASLVGAGSCAAPAPQPTTPVPTTTAVARAAPRRRRRNADRDRYDREGVCAGASFWFMPESLLQQRSHAIWRRTTFDLRLKW